VAPASTEGDAPTAGEGADAAAAPEAAPKKKAAPPPPAKKKKAPPQRPINAFC
jgi:hypothetical protein